MQWNVPRALAVLGGVGVAFVAAIGLFGAANIKDAGELHRYQEAAISAGRADMMHDAIRGDVLNGLLATDAAGLTGARADVEAHRATMLAELGVVEESLADSPEALAFATAARPVLDTYAAAALAVIDAAASDSAAVDARRGEFSEQFEALEVQLAGLADVVLEVGSSAEQANRDATAAARRRLELASAFGVVSMLAASWLIARSIRRPLELCGADVAASAVQIQASGSHLMELVGRNTNDAEESRISSVQVGENVQAIAEATSELTSAIGEIARATTMATSIAEGAVTTVTETADNIDRLGASTSEIGAVVDLITSIAEQTNLLALNATIEAARAGASGKGFAIVANEVKQLAGATADATTTITDSITRIQQEAGVAAQQVAEVREVIGQISDAQVSISAAIEQQSYTTAEIATRANTAAAEAGEISGRAEQVAAGAHDNLDTVEATISAADVLGRVAGKLATLVGSR